MMENDDVMAAVAKATYGLHKSYQLLLAMYKMGIIHIDLVDEISNKALHMESMYYDAKHRK
jgi:hypothetical protein